MNQLDAYIARVRALGQLPEVAARQAAPLVEQAVRETAQAGESPDGTPWLPKKRGGRALVNAADHLSAAAVGGAIVVTLEGHAEVEHNFGNKKDPKRQILPDGGAGIPANVAIALERAAAAAFAKIMGSP